jgi:transcriptional regulator with GAF, ATPase, and Fis domain
MTSDPTLTAASDPEPRPVLAVLEQTPLLRQLEAYTRLCRLRVDAGSDLRSLLARVIQLCAHAVLEADDVSLVIGSPMHPTLTVASSAAAQTVDGVQHLRGCGPALDAYRSHRPVALGTRAVAEHPGLRDDPQAAVVTSLLALPLIIEGRATGVLTLYARRSQRLATMTALREAMPFVEVAQTLFRETQSYAEMRQTTKQLEAALISRAVIDQAKGMVMAGMICDADEAFAHLSRLSSARHQKLRDVAQGMVDNVLVERSLRLG